jgi:hypothetical protein
MRTRDRTGFTLIELAVVAVIAFLAMSALFSAYNEGIMRSVGSSLAVRGRDIYVAVAAANAEREPLGAPSLWTSALDQATRARLREGPVTAEFSSSTELFRCLIENRLCAGLTYESLAGGGVPTGGSGTFGPTNNIWDVAVNRFGDLPDTTPLLVTRNVDLSPTAVKMSQSDLSQALRCDPAWREPLGRNCVVIIRRGGAIFMGRMKKATYRTLCGGEPFDARVDKNGQAVPRPLTYLTPSRAVVPGGISP